jgi:hypothetical protein
MKRPDLWTSAFWLLIGLSFTCGGFRYGFGSWTDPGSGWFSVLFGLTLSGLSLGLLLNRLLGAGTRGASKPFWLTNDGARAVVGTILALVAYALVLKQTGYLVTSFLLSLFLLRFISALRWSKSLIAAFLFAGVSYLLFAVVLGANLPEGRLYGTFLKFVGRL